MKIKPFFKIDLNTNIKNIDVSSIKNLDLYQLIQFKEFLKRINSENKFFINQNVSARVLLMN